MKVFIGGSKTISKLNEKMRCAIDVFCEQNAQILIGDCFGADKLVQQYLPEKGYKKVTVYVSGDIVRNNQGDFEVRHIDVPKNVSGYEFYRRKDIAMANEADCGLMLWDGKTKGTLCNINELRAQQKNCIVISSQES